LRPRSGQVAQLVALMMMVVALVAVLLFKAQCGRAVGGFFESLDEPAPSR
jgi:hypothetical protein